MLQYAKKIRDIVASNVSSALDAATDPVKMLRLLRGEIEDSIVAINGKLTQIRNRSDKIVAELVQLDLQHASWEDRAAAAVKADRDDLARAALAQKEALADQMQSLRKEVAASSIEIRDLTNALETLAARHRDTQAQLEAAEREAGTNSARETATEKRLRKVDALDQRAGFAAGNKSVVSPAAAADARSFEAGQRIEAELARLKDKATSAAKRNKR